MLTIRLKKNPDGTSALTLVRADGTSTWQKQRGPQARFFPHHDLTHLAVEAELGIQQGFYGLVAEGWEFDDFGSPWPRGPLPPEALGVEVIVGMLDLDRSMRARGDAALAADGLNELVTAHYHAHGHADPPRLTDEQLQRIRGRMAELFAEWEALAPGESLQLRFGRRDSGGR